MRTLIRVSMALVALAAFALSFATLMALARLAGYGSLSWLYPVTLDLGTVSSCSAWLVTRSRQAFHLTWSLLVASILLNGVEHWLVATGLRPAWWLITVIAMAPPAILGVVTHLAVGLGPRPAEVRGGTESAGADTAQVGEACDVNGASGADRPGQLGTGKAELAGLTPPRDESPGVADVSQVAGAAACVSSDYQVADVADAVNGVDHTGRPGLSVSRAGAGSTAAPRGTKGQRESTHSNEIQRGIGDPDQVGEPGNFRDASKNFGGAAQVSARVQASEPAMFAHPDPIAELIESGVGRRKLARELSISEHRARVLLAERRSGSEVSR